MKRLAVAGVLCIWLAAGVCLAQAERGTWPLPGRDLWYAIAPRADLSPGQADAVFERAVAEGAGFLDPRFGVTLFLAKGFRLTKGRSADRKKYPGRPERADDLRIAAEWRTGDMNQHRGQSYCFIAMDAIRSLDLHFVPNLRERFPKAPEGRNWNVNVLAGGLYNFFFASEETARNFIDALASLLARRGLELKLSRFGLMWENVTPAQAADLGPVGARRDGPAGAGQAGRPPGAGVLVTSVAIAGAADRAGIRPLDVIIEFNGVAVTNFSHLSLLLDGIAAGGRASLVVLRRLRDPNLHPEPSAWNALTVELADR